MLTAETWQQVQLHLQPAQTILIFLPPQANLDQVTTATALALALNASGRNAQVIAPEFPDLPEEQLANIAGAEMITTELGNRDLHVSFPYQPEQVDKVSYHIDDQTQMFNLVIKPLAGHRPLDISKVQMIYAGAEADLIFTVGVSSLDALGDLPERFADLFHSTVMITLHTFEPSFGSLKLDATGLSSLSELAAELLFHQELPMDGSVATNLLMGIEEVTDSFKSMVMTADTFDVVARLMRLGARRIRRRDSRVGQSMSGQGVNSQVAGGQQRAAERVAHQGGFVQDFSEALRKGKANHSSPRHQKNKKAKHVALELSDDVVEADSESDEQAGGLHYQPSGNMSRN
jgi:hypothetical protein